MLFTLKAIATSLSSNNDQKFIVSKNKSLELFVFDTERIAHFHMTKVINDPKDESKNIREAAFDFQGTRYLGLVNDVYSSFEEFVKSGDLIIAGPCTYQVQEEDGKMVVHILGLQGTKESLPVDGLPYIDKVLRTENNTSLPIYIR